MKAELADLVEQYGDRLDDIDPYAAAAIAANEGDAVGFQTTMFATKSVLQD